MTRTWALRAVALPLAASLLIAAAMARAAPDTADGGRLSLQAGAAVGPYGARVRAGWSETRALPGEGILWRGREASAGGTVGVTPASAQLGLEASIVPIAFLELRARYEVTGYAGMLGSLWRAPSRHAPFDDGDIERSRARPGVRHTLLLAPALRARLGRLVLRNETDLSFIALSRRSGWYRLPEEDTLVAPRDLIVSDQLAALVEAWRGRGEAGLLLGPAAEITWAARADLTRVRLGGIAVLTLSDRLGTLSRPRLFASAGVAARDRNRAGEPFAVVGMSADLQPGAAAAPVASPP